MNQSSNDCPFLKHTPYEEHAKMYIHGSTTGALARLCERARQQELSDISLSTTKTNDGGTLKIQASATDPAFDVDIKFYDKYLSITVTGMQLVSPDRTKELLLQDLKRHQDKITAEVSIKQVSDTQSTVIFSKPSLSKDELVKFWGKNVRAFISVTMLVYCRNCSSHFQKLRMVCYNTQPVPVKTMPEKAVSILPENSLATLYPGLNTEKVSATSPPVNIQYVEGFKNGKDSKSEATLIYAGRSPESIQISAKRKQAANEFLTKHTDVYYLNDAKTCTTKQEYVQKFLDDWSIDHVLWNQYSKYQICRKHRIMQFLNGLNTLNPLPVKEMSGTAYDALVATLKEKPGIEDIVQCLFPPNRQFLFTEQQLRDLVPEIMRCDNIRFRMEMYKQMQDALLAIMHANPVQFVSEEEDTIIGSFLLKSMKLSVQPTNDGLDISLTQLADTKKRNRELQRMSLRVQGRDVHIISESGFEPEELINRISLQVPKEDFQGFDVDFYKEGDNYRVSIFCNGIWDVLGDKAVKAISRECFIILFGEYM